jgi:hypothetical protein
MNVIRKSSEKKKILLHAHIGSLHPGRNNIAFFLLPKPIDWDWFFLIMALSFSLVWAICFLILLGYVFLVEGRRDRNKSNPKKEEDPFPHHLIQECEALWKITAGKHKDPGMGNPN